MSIQELLNSEVGLNLLDKELVLAYALGVSREHLMAHGEEEVSDEDLAVIFSYFRRLQAGEPLAYIVEEKEFFGLPFFVDRRVLIPRPETELLVERTIEREKERRREGEKDGGEKLSGGRILDIGTGSGAIAISVAVNLPDCEVVALEVSAEAVEVAKVNAELHGVTERVRFLESDLLAALADGEHFSVICANLPYIGEVRHRFIEAAVERFEPNVALFGGEDGLVLYRRLFEQILEKKVTFDLLIGEFGFSQAEAMAAELELFFGGRWVIESDLAGIERVFVVFRERNV